MQPLGEGRHRCERTGLVVVEAPTVALWRVFKTSDGPLNPPVRFGTPNVVWGRFDIAGVATVYGASHSRGAFVETLAALAPSTIDFSALFDDVAPGQRPVDQDWAELHHMPRGSTAAQWRMDRQLSELLVLDSGNYVDVMAGDTISVLRAHADDWAPNADSKYRRIDTSALAGPDRTATCAVAAWLRRQVLDDGSTPAGIRYASKHGGDLPCWAIWVGLADSGKQEDVRMAVGRHIAEVSRSSIAPSDPDFGWAAASLGLVPH